MDAAQFKAAVFCWRDLLYRLALRLLNNSAEAEDAVQQTMMKLWQKKEALNEIKNLKSFVIKTLQNDCQKYCQPLKTNHCRSSRARIGNSFTSSFFLIYFFTLIFI